MLTLESRRFPVMGIGLCLITKETEQGVTITLFIIILKSVLFEAKPGNNNPKIDEHTPKIILKVHWIFQPKNEDIPYNNDGIQVQNNLNSKCISQHQISVAIQFGKWYIKIE